MNKTKHIPSIYVEIEDYDDTTDSIVWLIQHRYPKIADYEPLILEETPEKKFHSPYFYALDRQTAKTFPSADQMTFYSEYIEFDDRKELEDYAKIQHLTLDEDFLDGLEEDSVFEGYLVTVHQRTQTSFTKQIGLYLMFGVDREEFKVVAEQHTDT